MWHPYIHTYAPNELDKFKSTLMLHVKWDGSDCLNSCLEVALEYDRLDIAKLLLETGESLDVITNESNSPANQSSLLPANQSNSSANQLTAQSNSPTSLTIGKLNRYKWRWSTLMLDASNKNQVEMIKLFIQFGADAWDEGLAGACHGGHIELVQFFIERGATDWNWGLTSACRGKRSAAIKLMIQKGATKCNWCNNQH